MPPSIPKLVLRPVAPDGLLPRQAFTLNADPGSSQCSIVSGKRTLGVCTNVTSVVPETLPASAVATANTPDVINRLLDGFNQTVLVVGLAGSGTSTFLEGSLPKNAHGGYLDGLMKSLFEALKVKVATPPVPAAVGAAGPNNTASANNPAASSGVEPPATMSFSASICVHEHYSELIRDLISSKRDKEIDTSSIQWDANAIPSLSTLTRRSVATHGDAMEAIGKAKLAKTNVKGRTEKTTVVYQIDLVQHMPTAGGGTTDLMSTLQVVELFAVDRLVTDQAAHSQVTRDSEAVGKQMAAIDAGLAMLGTGPFEVPEAESQDEDSPEPFNMEQSLLTYLMHPLFEFNSDLFLVVLVNTGSDASIVSALFTYLSNLTATVRTFPVPGTQDTLCARRVRRARELQIKAQAELALKRLALDGGKDDLRQRIVTMTRDNDRLHDTISNLSAQLADLRDQLKVATALRDDSEAHLTATSATQMAAAAEVARLTDRLSNTTKELELVRARLVSAETERDNLTRALGQSTEKCTTLASELDNMQLRLAILETQVAGARKDLGGETEQAEELSVELLRVVQWKANVEKERREALEQVRVLRMRLKEVENDQQALAKENERLVARIRDVLARPNCLGSPNATLAGETFLSVAERVETELVGQVKAIQSELDAARARYREMGMAYRNRLQQYVDKTCHINLANEMFSTIKTIVDSMLNDVIMSLMESEQHAHTCLNLVQSRLASTHDLVVQLLHLAVVLQGGKRIPGSEELAKVLSSHEQFQKVMSTDPAQQLSPTTRRAQGNYSTTSDANASRKLAQDMIAKYIATTHSQMEEERSELLTRALVAEAAVREWETVAAKSGLKPRH